MFQTINLIEMGYFRPSKIWSFPDPDGKEDARTFFFQYGKDRGLSLEEVQLGWEEECLESKSCKLYVVYGQCNVDHLIVR